MTRYLTLRWLRRPFALAGLVAVPALACTDTLLNVTDPDIILQANSAASATALANGAVLRLTQAVSGTQGPDALFMFGGLLTDEWRSGDTFIQRNTMDQRIFDPNNTFNAGPFRNINRVRTQARLAIDGLRTYLPNSLADIARMFAFIGYTQVLMGEHYCNGVPLSSISGTTVVFGDPISNDSLFQLAIASADSALGIVRGGDSARVVNFAKVIRGRALLDRGDTAGAKAAVAGVPRSFRYEVTHSLNVNDNQMWALNASSRRYTLGDREGGNGLPYVTGDSVSDPIVVPPPFDTLPKAGDPRIPRKTGPDGIFDSAFPIQVIRQGAWGRTSAVMLASGIEARLIVAEVALRGSDATAWLDTLNALRADPTLLPVPQDTSFRPVAGTTLAPLADPGPSPNDSLRVDLLFRERGFWMFSTGHRLGDMRRLIRPTAAGGYGRAVNTVYPTGPWFKGGDYGNAIQMSIPVEELNNPNFHGCTDLNP
jgi:starch-binding outer membrane protein, SusD/RagB family